MAYLSHIARRAFLTSAIGAGASAGLSSALSGQTVETGAQSLKAVASACGIVVGAQVERKPLQYGPFADTVRHNFNLITPGNEFKWTRVRPTPETFYFDDADWMMDFARSSGLLVHGHNLCWNTANPPWFDSVLTKANARQFLTEHISTVTKRYAGRIDSWDVVNEAVVPWNTWEGLYPGVWLNLLGQDYIDIAFHTTAESDPKALRVLNLHHIEYETPDCEKTQQRALALLKKLIGRGVPIQAVGLESHIGSSPPPVGDLLIRFMDGVRSLGLQVLITELDVNDTAVEGDFAARDSVVARCYYDYLTRVVPAGGIKRVIFWTPSDKWVWMNSMRGEQYVRPDKMPHRAGLLDEFMRPKSAYREATDALRRICTEKEKVGKS